uniref:Uncharacterized protein n=1 Tax=Arundo donax TaxID=35708 RepID=A0A0A9A319_ARUDO
MCARYSTLLRDLFGLFPKRKDIVAKAKTSQHKGSIVPHGCLTFISTKLLKCCTVQTRLNFGNVQ